MGVSAYSGSFDFADVPRCGTPAPLKMTAAGGIALALRLYCVRYESAENGRQGNGEAGKKIFLGKRFSLAQNARLLILLEDVGFAHVGVDNPDGESASLQILFNFL